MKRSFILLSIFALIWACNPKSTKKETTPAASGSTFPVMYVFKETVNLRQGPTARSAKVAELQDGDALQILENSKGWYRVSSESGHKGWLRSDLAGPRNLSKTRLAAAFADSIMPAFGAEMFFDKTALYKIVYLTLEKKYYQSTAAAKEQAKKIGRAYQQKVYPGAVELRLLKPNSQELFSRIHLKAIGLSDVPVPIIPFGKLYSLSEKDKAVTIKMAVPIDISQKKLLKAARKMSARYDYPFVRTEIYMVSDTPVGQGWLRTGKIEPQRMDACRLYYLEDADGEDYRFRFCDR